MIKILQKKIFLSLGLWLLCTLPLSAEETQIAAKLSSFADSIIQEMESKAQINSTIAIADFDNKSSEASHKNLGFATSEIITERFAKSGKFHLIEKKQITRVVNSLELSLTGLYDSDKALSIGKLINAKYLILGSVTKLGGFYRLSVRVVVVETGSILLTNSIDLESDLLEDTAKRYQPPAYRFHIGSSMSWFGFDNNQNAIYSIGLTLGWHYNITGPHSVILQTIYSFGLYSIANDRDTETESIHTTYYLKNTFVNLAGYGYRIPATRNISIQPNIFAGFLAGQYQEKGNYNNSTDSKDNKKWVYSGVVQPRLDIIFMEKNPLSFYIGLGYFYYTRKISDNFHNLTINKTLQGVNLEGALLVYF